MGPGQHVPSNAGISNTVDKSTGARNNKKIRATITYPKSTGRNFNEILRVIDSMQLTDGYSVATPVDWKDGDDVVILPSITNPDVIKEKFPKGCTELKPYLRLTPQPNR